jgi:nicotinate phosphoribosyltransferase
MNDFATPLLTDAYQFTMLQALADHGMNETAVFEFFVRKLPRDRNFLIAAGLEQVIDYLENLRFTPDELDWLKQSGLVRPGFVDTLADFHFTGSVHAVPEGTVVFPNEPLLRVEAPMREAQLVESRLINLLHFQTMIASKAVRVRMAAPDKLIFDFGLRRAHGAEAGLLSARASYIAGFSGTATVLAGTRWGIPLFGTMAHSFIQAHASEAEAFRDFAESHPDRTVLLIDTYDTEAAARGLVPLAQALAMRGIDVRGIRMDSGDLADHARQVRRILDQGGLPGVRIYASGDLDEYKLRTLAEAPIDGFGVGTRMNTSADAPYLDCAYKLQEYAGIPRRKRSAGKATWPGSKQVFRYWDAQGKMAGDLLTTADDHAPGEPLLKPVLAGGKRLADTPGLDVIRQHVCRQLDGLPLRWRGLESAESYPVSISPRLEALAKRVDASIPRWE